MIVVKIELWSAITHAATEIGRMYIANTRQGSVDRGDYDVAVCRRGSEGVPSGFALAETCAPKAARTGKVTDYPRQAYNVWRLITRACLAVFPEEIKTKPGKSFTPTITPEVMRGIAQVVIPFCDAIPKGTPMENIDPNVMALLEWINTSMADK